MHETARQAGVATAACLLALLAGPAKAAKIVYDYAEVVSVEAIVETLSAPSPVACEAPPAPPPGDLRVMDPGLDLVSAIRREASRPPAAGERGPCFAPAAERRRTEVVGYRVRYRYGGEVYERMMDAHPGERLRVRVTLAPHRRR
jgi:uncharacterized protein YcfJ